MSKKHFIALADAFKRTRPSTESPKPTIEGCDQWVIDMFAIASVCEDANPRFNRDRWIAYIYGECGPNGGRVRGGK